METIMKYYLEEKKVPVPVANVLSEGFKRNPDIAEEFKKWIASRTYEMNGALEICGYSAQKIHEIAPHLDASGVFSFLVTLRENPDRAKETIKNNFPEK